MTESEIPIKSPSLRGVFLEQRADYAVLGHRKHFEDVFAYPLIYYIICIKIGFLAAFSLSFIFLKLFLIFFRKIVDKFIFLYYTIIT